MATDQKHVCQKSRRKAFTFIELLMAILLMGLAFFPIMNLFATAIAEFQATSEYSTALNLGREGMEMLRNRDLPVERLEKIGSFYYPPQKDPPLFLNNIHWRVHTVVHPGTRPLQVEVEVSEEEPGRESKPPFVLTTLLQDLI